MNVLTKAATIAAILSVAAPASAAVYLRTSPPPTNSKNGNVVVSANVAASCGVTGTTLAFGTYDPLVANAIAPLTTTAPITVTCTAGSTASLTVGASNGNTVAVNDPAQSSTLKYQVSKRTETGSHTALNYTFSLADNTAVGAGGVNAPFSYPLSGSIAPAQDVAIGNYADLLVATVSF